MNESLYDLLPREEVRPAKPPGANYRSQFRRRVVDDEKEARVGQHKTFGEAKTTLPHTKENFLRKHTDPREKLAFNLKKAKTCDCPEDKGTKQTDKKCIYGHNCPNRKPPIPKSDEVPVHGLRTQKDFVHDNAVDNILTVPRRPEKGYIDKCSGDRFLLDTSGLEPKYIEKKDFGRVPGYLSRRKQETKQAQEEYNNYVAEHYRRGALDKLSEGERRAIINGLKGNWERIHHEFQGLSVMTDTIPKKIRKEKMVTEMKKLEKDIELLEKHSVIYIANQ